MNTWAVSFLAAGTMWVVIAALWLRHERRRRLDTPWWWERDIRHNQINREASESKPHIFNS